MANPIWGFLGQRVAAPVSATIESIANATSPIKIPEAGDIIDALARGVFPFQAAKRALQLHGILIDDMPGFPTVLSIKAQKSLSGMWDRVIEAQASWPDWPDLQTLWLMGLASDRELLESLERQKMPEAWRKRMLALANPVPPPSDLIRYVVRDVFDSAAYTTFSYEDEFPAVAQAVGKFAQRYGYTQVQDVPGYPTARGNPFTWLLAEWMSHWQLPSPEQGYEMFRRLRPGRYKDAKGNPVEFTKDQLFTLLKTLDYPPFWRDRLLAISYRPLQTRQVQTLLRSGIVSPQEGVERLQDGGYDLQTSQLLASYLTQADRITALVTARRAAQRLVLSSYREGTIDRDEAALRLYQLSLNGPAVIAAFAAQPAAAQAQAAANDALTQTLLDSADLAERQTDVKQMIAAIRRMYVSYSMDWNVADARLRDIGVQAVRRNRLHALWDVQRLVPSKPLSHSQLLRYLEQGLLTPEYVRSRLEATGVPLPEIDVLIAAAQLQAVQRQAKAILGFSTVSQDRARALKAQVKAAQQAQKEAQAALSKSASPVKLEQWLLARVLTPEQYLSRVVQLGISPDDAQRVVQWTQQKQAAAQAKLDQAAHKQDVTGGPPPKPGTPQGSPGVSRSVLTGWLKKGIIKESEFTDKMKELGFSDDNINKWITQYGPAS